MGSAQYWDTAEQAWIMPVLWELTDEGAVGHASDWASLRADIGDKLSGHGAASMTESLVRPLEQAVAAGADFKELVTALVREYQAAHAHASTRLVSIGPVEGYPGWWQGYDTVDEAWKAVKSAAEPTEQTTGWIRSADVDWNAVAQPHDTTAQPTWDDSWRMFHRRAADGGFEFADALTPGDQSSGCGTVWLTHEQAAARHAPTSRDAEARAAVDAVLKEVPGLKSILTAEEIASVVSELA